MQISERLRHLMGDKHLTQAQLASAAGCSEASISRYLHDDDAIPPTQVLIGLSSTLGVSVDYILGLTKIPALRNSDEEFSYVLYQCYARANDRDRQLVGMILNEYLTEDEVAMRYDLT